MRATVLVLATIIGGLAWQADAQPRQADKAAPLYLQADELIYEAGADRVITRGNVELYFNNYIVTADEMVYEKADRKLIAKGRAQLKNPDGTVTRADRLELSSDFVEGFEATLKAPPTDRRMQTQP